MKTPHGKQIRVSKEIHKRLKLLVLQEDAENLYLLVTKILTDYLDRLDARKARRDGK